MAYALQKGDAAADAARASLLAAEVLAAGLRAVLDGQPPGWLCLESTFFL